MASPKQLAAAARLAALVHRGMGDDLRRLREDAGVSRQQLADAAGLDVTFVRRIEYGTERPSVETYARLSAALGADLRCRLYPNTGPAIRDRHQARILEALVGIVHRRWRAHPEVAVRHPSRGWIDVVFHAAREGEVVATEIQSDLRRLEQLLRWFPEKVASLPSWEGWPHLRSTTPPSQLLIVRSTKATQSIARLFARQIAVAYPVHPADALESLRGTAPWPGSALVWVDIRNEGVRFIPRR